MDDNRPYPCLLGAIMPVIGDIPCCRVTGVHMRKRGRDPPVLLEAKIVQLTDLQTINYHPQSGWFEDTPLKGGTEQGYPLKGV